MAGHPSKPETWVRRWLEMTRNCSSTSQTSRLLPPSEVTPLTVRELWHPRDSTNQNSLRPGFDVHYIGYILVFCHLSSLLFSSVRSSTNTTIVLRRWVEGCWNVGIFVQISNKIYIFCVCVYLMLDQITVADPLASFIGPWQTTPQQCMSQSQSHSHS